MEKELITMMKKMQNKSSWPKFTWTRFLLEAFIIGAVWSRMDLR